MQRIGWMEDLEKTSIAMNDIVYNTPHKVGPIIMPDPKTPTKAVPFKRRILFNTNIPAKKLKFDEEMDSTDGTNNEIDITPLLEEIPNDECIKYEDLTEEARKILQQLSFQVVNTCEKKALGFK